LEGASRGAHQIQRCFPKPTVKDTLKPQPSISTSSTTHLKRGSERLESQENETFKHMLLDIRQYLSSLCYGFLHIMAGGVTQARLQLRSNAHGCGSRSSQ
jgi:hypothetical protein